MTKENAILLFEKFYANGYTEDEKKLFSIMYVSLISSDTCYSEENCLDSLKILNNLIEGLNEAKVPDEFKNQFFEYLTTGVSIVERDLKDIRDGNFGYC